MRKYVDGMVDPRQGKFDSGDGLIIFSRNQGSKMQPDQYIRLLVPRAKLMVSTTDQLVRGTARRLVGRPPAKNYKLS